MILLIIFVSPIPVFARAGGGSSGGSASSSGGVTNHSSSKSVNSNPAVSVIKWALILMFSSSTVIIVEMRLLKAKIKTKQKMKKLNWNYKELKTRVEEAYFIIQKSWSKNDMYQAEEYMTKDLFENFKIKLEWMEISNKRNILKRIKLLESYPISLNDNVEDTKDKIWVYIKGKMIDYIIDTKTEEMIEGSKLNRVFVEYWLFNKNTDGKWVLSKILQEDELPNILVQKQ